MCALRRLRRHAATTPSHAGARNQEIGARRATGSDARGAVGASTASRPAPGAEVVRPQGQWEARAGGA